MKVGSVSYFNFAKEFQFTLITVERNHTARQLNFLTNKRIHHYIRVSTQSTIQGMGVFKQVAVFNNAITHYQSNKYISETCTGTIGHDECDQTMV